MNIQRRLKLFEANLAASFRKPAFCTPPFLKGVLGVCDAVSVETPERSLRLAQQICLPMALMLDDRHLLARSYATIGSGLRATGLLAEAEAVYATAGEFAKACPCREPRFKIREGDVRCQPDLFRRMAFLKLAQQDHKEALRLANAAVEAAVEEEFRARALICLGGVDAFRSDISKAIKSLATAIDQLPLGGRWHWIREMRQMFHGTALLALSFALSKSDSPEDVRLGLRLLPTVLKRWKGLPAGAVARAEIDWTTAGLMLKAIKLSLIPEAEVFATRFEAIQLLESVPGRLVARTDVAGACADLAAAFLPDLIRIEVIFSAMTNLPAELQPKRQAVLRAQGGQGVKKALHDFREGATALGSSPAVFSY
jgi:hypothetical protein